MEAVRVTGYGGVDKLVVDQLPIPTPGPYEVLIMVCLRSNNSELNMREGAYGTDTNTNTLAGWRREGISFPRIPGSDIAGDIVEVGSEINTSRLNEKVILFPFRSELKNGEEDITYIGSEYDGGYAQYVTWPAELCFPLPLEDYLESSIFPVSGLTSWHKVNRTNLKEGETVLVTGATGGVESFNVQIASKIYGSKVIAVVGDWSQKNSLLELGATDVVSYRSNTLLEDIFDAAGGPVNAVLDVVGQPLFSTSMAALKREGRFNTEWGDWRIYCRTRFPNIVFEVSNIDRFYTRC
ncbi:zinc-binding dehydrogenase [Alteribacillus iranensis]|nr:zinc-binding dehydrogenase [Alteribacillus iranensis]